MIGNPSVSSTVELLAPVPADLLLDASEFAGEREVAFGSRAWEVFRELDAIRGGDPVRVWIYASHDPERPLPPTATWTGRYVHGCVKWHRDDRGAGACRADLRLAAGVPPLVPRGATARPATDTRLVVPNQLLPRRYSGQCPSFTSARHLAITFTSPTRASTSGSRSPLRSA